MRNYLPVLLVAVLILASGCLTSVGPAAYSDEYVNKLPKYAVYNEGDIQECKLGQCLCLACKNQSSLFFFFKSYVGGSCRFVPDCTRDTFYGKMLNKSLDSDLKDLLPRQFMIGTGYSFSSFTEANGWCGNRLDMAVQWLVGDNDTPYSLPRADRAMCYIDKEVMPVYVLYSNSQNINTSQTREIARILGTGGPSSTLLGAGGPVGPVVITTEIDFNSSDTTGNVMANVATQVREINSMCRNNRPNEIYCFVALAPKMGDTEAVAKLFEDPEIRGGVDLIAFGINSHTVNLNQTYEQTCNPAEVYQKALKFARFALYNYSKPTIIPYILFDANGTDASGKCNWTEATMIQGYSSFFPKWLMTFKNAGVIGAAAYDFNSSQFSITSPLNCSDCALGKNNARLQAWFSTCRSYKIVKGNNFGDNAIVFANESGGYCDFSSNFIGSLSMYSGSFASSQPPPLAQPNESFIRCDACMNENMAFPFNVTDRYTPTADWCTKFPILDFFADKRNLDPMLVRAVVAKESYPPFDPCSAAQVPDGGCGNGSKGYDFVPDVPEDGICHYADTKPPGKEFCALGLMQVIEPPYTFWPAEINPEGVDGVYYDGNTFDPKAKLYKQAPRGNITWAKSECSPYFNPYNVTHSACFGTAKLEFYVRLGEAKAKSKSADLEIGGNANKERILGYYFGLNYYYGTGGRIDGWIDDFAVQKVKTENDCGTDYGVCCGNKDFINFVHRCKGSTDTDAEYGWRVFAWYRGFVETCPTASCPSCKRIAVAANQPLPQSCTPPPMNASGIQRIPLTPRFP